MKKKIILGVICFLILLGISIKIYSGIKEREDVVNSKKDENSLVILMYHGVRDDAWGDESLFQKIADFDNQMKYLYDSGFTPIFLSEIENAKDYKKPIVITFDDGYIDVYENAFPILKKYNFKSNFFLITSLIGSSGYVNEKMIKELDKTNLFEIGSHTDNHVNLTTLSEGDLVKELKISKEKLEKIINKEVNTIAYPYGGHNKLVLDTTKNIYKHAVIVKAGRVPYKSFDRVHLYRYGISRDITLERYAEIVNGE